MNKILIGSHSDLLIYDPVKLSLICDDSSDKLYIFIPNINNLDKNYKFKAIIKKYNLNIIFIPDVEANPKLCNDLFLIFKEFIKTKNINYIYICNPIRLHCYVCYLASFSLRNKCHFSYYQGSLLQINSTRNLTIYRLLNKYKYSRWLVKRKITFKLSKIINLLKKYSQILKIINQSFNNIASNKLISIKLSAKTLIYQGIKIDSLVSHDEIGFNLMQHDIPFIKTNKVKANSLILSNKKNKHTSIKKNYSSIYLLPSLVMDSSLTSPQAIKATNTWLDLIDFINLKKPQIKIYAKLHPRIDHFKEYIANCFKNRKVTIIPSEITIDNFLNENSLVLSDVSSVICYCELNNIKAISYQTEAICGPCFYYFKLPAYFTETMSIIKTKEQILNYLT